MFEKFKFEIKKMWDYTTKTYVSEDVSKITNCFFCSKIDHQLLAKGNLLLTILPAINLQR